MLSFFVIHGPLFQRVNLMHAELVSESQSGLPRYLQYLGNEPSPQNQIKLAGHIYSLYGIAVPVRDAEGRYNMYQPTETDLKHWSKVEEANRLAKSTQDMLDKTLSEIFVLAAIHILSIFSVFTVGLAILALRTRRTG